MIKNKKMNSEIKYLLSWPVGAAACGTEYPLLGCHAAWGKPNRLPRHARPTPPASQILLLCSCLRGLASQTLPWALQGLLEAARPRPRLWWTARGALSIMRLKSQTGVIWVISKWLENLVQEKDMKYLRSLTSLRVVIKILKPVKIKKIKREIKILVKLPVEHH